MEKKRDTDYLAISARVRVLENRLLTRERMEQLIEAREDGEVTRLLAECGYPEPRSLSPVDVEAALTRAQAALFADLAQALGPGDHLLPVFRIRYDYHNAKAALKAQATGTDPRRLLVPGGRYDPQALCDAVLTGAPDNLSDALKAAVEAARTVLEDTRDPQRADFVLDRACYGEMLDEARAGGEFLTGYVQTLIDALNLRAAVRANRAGRDRTFLEAALIPGGGVSAARLAAAQPDDLPALYRDTPLKEAAALGVPLAAGARGDMTAFERSCDNAVAAYVKKARRVPFGVEPVAGYLYARQAELTALRIILSGRAAGLEKDVIRERLREAYV